MQTKQTQKNKQQAHNNKTHISDYGSNMSPVWTLWNKQKSMKEEIQFIHTWDPQFSNLIFPYFFLLLKLISYR